MTGLQGDIGQKGGTLKSTKRGLRGFRDIEFWHEATLGQTVINFLELINPTGIKNESPNVLGEAIKEGSLIITNGEGRTLARGIDYNLNGSSLTLIDTAALDGEIFYGTIRNAPQQGSISLLDGVALSPRGFLDVGVDIFNIGRAIKIPTGNEPEQIIVLRNRVQEVFGDDYTLIDNGSGFSQIIQFVRPGELLEGGFNEFIQVFANGFIVEKQPNGVNAKLDQFRGQLTRMADILETDLAIDPLSILLGAPTNEDLKFFGDNVLLNTAIINALLDVRVAIVDEVWVDYTPIWTGTNPEFILGKYKQRGKDLDVQINIRWDAGTAHGAFPQVFNVPPQFNIDGSQLVDNIGNRGNLGRAYLLDAGTNFPAARIFYNQGAVGTGVGINTMIVAGADIALDTIASNTTPFTWTTTDQANLKFTVPITQPGFQTLRQKLGL